MQRLIGIGVSPGVVSGRAVVLSQRAQVLRYRIAREKIDSELARLERARVLARDQLTAIGKRLERRPGPELASLFDAQILMLEDPLLIPRAAELVRERHLNAEWALQQVLDESGETCRLARGGVKSLQGLVGRDALADELRHAELGRPGDWPILVRVTGPRAGCFA